MKSVLLSHTTKLVGSKERINYKYDPARGLNVVADGTPLVNTSKKLWMFGTESRESNEHNDVCIVNL
jgi:hypothetical protein